MEISADKAFKDLHQLFQLSVNWLSLALGSRQCRLCLAELSLKETFLCQDCRLALTGTPIIETLPAALSPLAGQKESSEILCLSLYSYEHRARLAVQALKYGRRTELVEPLAKALYTAFAQAQASIQLDSIQLDGRQILVTAVPLHKSKKKERGFNQSELLARHLASFCALTYRPLLQRHRQTRAQFGLSKVERFSNLEGAISCTDPKLIAGRTVLVVDDVVTSGATALACSRSLMAAGANRVIVLALCRARLRQSVSGPGPGT